MLYILLTWTPLVVIMAIYANNQVTASSAMVQNCTDKSPYCNQNDCSTRPGYALEYCRKTCGNCQAFCQESQYVSCNVTAKADCEFMLRDYCPIMCGLCRPIKKKRPKVIISTTTLPLLSTQDIRTTQTPSTAKTLSMFNETSTQNPLLRNNSLTFLESPLDDNSILENPSQMNARLSPPITEQNKFLNVRRSDYHERLKPGRPRAYSVYNSGKSLPPNPPAEKVNVRAVPLISNFKNQIIIPPRVRKAQPTRNAYLQNYIQPRPYNSMYPQSINHMTTLYPPYPIDYGDMGFYRTAEPPAPPVQPQPIPLLSSNYYQQQPIVVYPMSPQSSQQMPHYQNYNYNFMHPRKTQATTTPPPFFTDYENVEPESENIDESFYAEGAMSPPPPPSPTTTTEKPRKNLLNNAVAIADLVTLLGCRDRDPIVCSKVTEESCRARPGFYLKLCPVKCKNCNGLACVDSNKIDCTDLQHRGGCRLPMAQEYCPKTCNTCPTPHFIAEQQSVCKDELETCEQLVESGVCEHPFSKPTLRIYCAKSCGFCKASQFYVNDYFDIPKSFNIYQTTET